MAWGDEHQMGGVMTMLSALCFLSNGQRTRLNVKTGAKTVAGIGKATDKAVRAQALVVPYILVQDYGQDGHPLVAVRDAGVWRDPDPIRDGSIRARLAAGWQPGS